MTDATEDDHVEEFSVEENPYTTTQKVPAILHPVFLALLLILIVAPLTVFCGQYISKHLSSTEPSIPNYPAGKAIAEDLQIINTKALSPEIEAANKLLLKAQSTSGDSRRIIYNQLKQDHPNTPQYTLIKKDHEKLIAKYQEFLSDRKTEQKKIAAQKQAERDRKSLTAYSLVMSRSYSEKRQLDELKKITQEHKGTKGAAEALEKIAEINAAINKRQADVQKRAAEKKKLEYELRQRQLEIKLRAPRMEFIAIFKKSLRDWNLKKAREEATKLLKDKRYPGLEQFSKNCIADVDALYVFDEILKKHYKAKLGQKTTITLPKGMRIDGTLTKVEMNHLILRRQLPLQRSTNKRISFPFGINIQKLFNIYTANLVYKNPSVEYITGLIYLVEGNKRLAKESFKRYRDEDKLKEHHKKLLNYFFNEEYE